MAFYVQYWGTILGLAGVGEIPPMLVSYTFGGPDHGAQYAMEEPTVPSIGYANGDIVSFDPEIMFDVISGTTTYAIQLRNNFPAETNFSLTGGGFA
jgi:hypothetical protein